MANNNFKIAPQYAARTRNRSGVAKYRVGDTVGFLSIRNGVMGGDSGKVLRKYHDGKEYVYVVQGSDAIPWCVPESTLDYSEYNHGVWRKRVRPASAVKAKKYNGGKR